MKTTITLVPQTAGISSTVTAQGGTARSVTYEVRSGEGDRVVTTGERSLDTVSGHVSFESSDGLPENPTWGKAVFFAAGDGLPEHYGIEVRAPLAMVDALIRDAEHALPASIDVEIEGMEADFSGSKLVWRWLPDSNDSPRVHAVGVHGIVIRDAKV